MKYIIYCTAGMKSNETMLSRSDERKFLLRWLEHRTGIARSRVQIPLKSRKFDFIPAVQCNDVFHIYLSLIITYHGKL